MEIFARAAMLPDNVTGFDLCCPQCFFPQIRLFGFFVFGRLTMESKITFRTPFLQVE